MNMLENCRQKRCARWLFAALMLLLVGGLPGCATVNNSMPKTVWQLREQYVKIEKQDHPAGLSVPVNAHPADIAPERLRYLLESIDVRLPGGEKAESLFNDDEIGVLNDKIREGLMLAGPDEDVAFAVVGHHAVLFGLKQRMITTGRIFCQGGQLNIIFGEILREVKDNEDLRLNPYRVGSRITGEPRELQLTVKQGSEAFSMKRPDWVIFPIAGPMVPMSAPSAPKGVAKPAADSKETPPAEPGQKKYPAAGKSIEERLMILNDLRNKKLITDEEYRVKRLEILNEL